MTGRQLESGRQWGTRRYQGPSKVEEATVVAVGGRAAILMVASLTQTSVIFP